MNNVCCYPGGKGVGGCLLKNVTEVCRICKMCHEHCLTHRGVKPELVGFERIVKLETKLFINKQVERRSRRRMVA